MIFLDDLEAVTIIKKHISVSPEFVTMRENSKELKSLIEGTGFIDELIDKIEGIESPEKAKARKKYSRDTQDLFERLFQPISNIYYASGGVKDFDIKGAKLKKTFLSKISNIRDGKPLSEWVQDHAIKLLNTDPNGIIYLEYKTEPELDIYPTYKSINSIRYYKAKGQMVDYLIFEPLELENKTYWRIVDDAKERTFIQEGETFTIVEDPYKTFDHPFGSVPALICSNIVVLGTQIRDSAIKPLLGLAKEIARDQSFLTLYKIYKGNPIFWKYVTFCNTCDGTGKDGDKSCTDCDGKGRVIRKSDVTDAVELPMPEDKDSPVITPEIAGFISPDLEVWGKYEETLDRDEKKLYKTHWGTNYGMQESTGGQKTATEVQFDKQPLENRLNKYADLAEYQEWKLCEWILNFYDLNKKREESKITINLGRRYTIESYDVLLQRYEDSKKAGENTVVLDKLFSEYLLAKYRNNPIDLQINLVKATIEPYLHNTLDEVSKYFGNEEAQRKILFQKFWLTVTEYNNPETIEANFTKWFDTNKKILPKTEVIPAK